jgi:type I restriction enzyme S subunit
MNSNLSFPIPNSELPQGWHRVKLGEVAKEFVNGGTPSTNISEYWDGNIPWITGADVTDFWVSGGRKFITEDGLKNSVTHLVPRNTILVVTRTGVGKVGIAANDLCFSQDITGVICSEEIYPEYLVWYIFSERNNLTNIQRGATIKGLTRNDIESLQIPLPPLEEQKSISLKIQELMQEVGRARTACEKQLEAAKALLAAFLREVFESEEAKKWERKRLGEVCQINPSRPKNFHRSHDSLTSFVPMAAVDEDIGTISKPEAMPYSKVAKGYTYFEENNVLFAKITPCMQNGKHVIARNLIDGIGFGTTEFHVLRPSHEILPEWVWYFIRQPHFLKEAMAYFTGAVGQQRVPATFLSNSIIPLPPVEEQKRIVASLERKMVHVKNLQSATQTQQDALNSFPQAILRQAFNGEL